MPKSKREKLFGDGRPRALDRNVKARIMHRARALMLKTAKGKAYGLVTAKCYAVLEALLWGFHNALSGLCFPSYEKIAEKAGCARSTVAPSIKALEAAGLMSWVNRIARVREAGRIRVIRISNAYHFHDPKPVAAKPDSSKSDFRPGTKTQDSISCLATAETPEINRHAERDAVVARARAGREAYEAKRRAAWT